MSCTLGSATHVAKGRKRGLSVLERHLAAEVQRLPTHFIYPDQSPDTPPPLSEKQLGSPAKMQWNVSTTKRIS